MKRDAFINGLYRYTLSRDWSEVTGDMRSVCFIMLNPSTADGQQEDPTLRKCIGFAKLLGFAKLSVVNLFALRATDPDQLEKQKKAGVNIIGPANDTFIFDSALRSDLIICAWGAYDGVDVETREQRVHEMLTNTQANRTLMCLGLTKYGKPRHPLYMPYSGKLLNWRKL